MPAGISYANVDPDSHLGLIREHVYFPIAQDDDYFSSASAGGSQAAMSIATSAAGDALLLSGQAAKPLFYGRRLQVTKTDASGTTLQVTVRFLCRRFGKFFYETIACTGSGTETVNGSRIVDEVISGSIVSITANAASDTLKYGVDDSWIGLKVPFSSYKDIGMVYRTAAGVPDAPGPKIRTDITSAMIKVRDAGIDLKTLYSAALAVTQTYLIEYRAGGSRAGAQSFNRAGYRFG